MALIAKLYKQDAWIREKKLEGPDKQKARTRYCEPVARAFWQWCEQQCQRLDLEPGHPLAKALAYARKRQANLMVFLADQEPCRQRQLRARKQGPRHQTDLAPTITAMPILAPGAAKPVVPGAPTVRTDEPVWPLAAPQCLLAHSFGTVAGQELRQGHLMLELGAIHGHGSTPLESHAQPGSALSHGSRFVEDRH